EPPLDLTPRADGTFWAQKLGGHLLPTGTVRLEERAGVTTLEGFNEGAWWVQDAAASIPAQLLGKVRDEVVVDLCAAPGGKTAQLAAKGANVTAIDITESRMKTLKENLKRLRLKAECITADALKWVPQEAPDCILLDAPCSATGTMRRHPDVAWNRTQDDVLRMAHTQYRLLNHALDILKPGGRLVYAVCSLQPEEGEGQITRLMENRKDVALMPIPPYYANYATSHGGIRTLPCHMEDSGGMDGFYTVQLIKNR
ncbi:MAG: RsmB/NOP family class I SAM-dependent RNA methyltransferase, partial [Alphaproteobacteria bacterium]